MFILQGRYAAALFSAANKNGSLEAVEKVAILKDHWGPKVLPKVLLMLLRQIF